MKLVDYQQPTCLRVTMEFVVGTSSLPCELFSLSKAAYVHVRSAQLCTADVFRFTCAMQWKLHG